MTSSQFKTLISAALILGFAVTGLGLCARWWPTLDIVNNGLPFTSAAAVLVLVLAAFARAWRLIIAAALLASVTVFLLVSALPGAAMQAPPGSERFLRVVTFNLWYGNDRIDDVAKFLARADADAVTLQEVLPEHSAALKQALQSNYPYSLGDSSIVILSKHPFVAEGRIDRPGFPAWNSLIVRWGKLEVNGTAFVLAGVHLARPFYPRLQQEDVAALTAFVRERTEPLILAGDFNMSPWTEKLGRFERSTGLERYNSVYLTWPMRHGPIPLLPLVAIDNVFASPDFAKIDAQGGTRLGSDHRPLIADIALAGRKPN